MLRLEKNERKRSKKHLALSIFSVGCIALGVYIASLIATPYVVPLVTNQRINDETIRQISPAENKLIIPKIGVNIDYNDTGSAALDTGAEWRHSSNGNPADGGNFVLAAHRFSIMPTPQDTFKKSPFFHMDKLEKNDLIIVDYKGKRYSYAVQTIKTVKPTDVYIEERTKEPQITLYTCDLSGPDGDRLVVIAKPNTGEQVSSR